MKVALRYLKAKRNTSFVSLISLFSVGGVAVGVLAMLVVLSVMDGFEEEMVKRLEKNDVHLLITPKENYIGDKKDKLIKSIYQSSAGVRQVYPVLQTEAILRAGKSVKGVILKGVSDTHLHMVKESLVDDSKGTPSLESGSSEIPIWLGADLAYNLSVLPGEQILLISPTETDGPVEAIPRVKKLFVAGFIRTEIQEKDMLTAWMPISQVRSFMRVRDGINRIEVKFEKIEQSIESAHALSKMGLSEFHIDDWVVLNSHLFKSLKLERLAMFIILLFIVLVASFNIVTTMTLTVMEKKREIGIMKSMGATNKMVSKIFLYKGLLTGSLGVFVGLTGGLLICYLLKEYSLIELPDVYQDRSLPVKVTPLYTIVISLSALSIVFFASWLPSRKTLKLTPIKGIKS